MRAASCIGSTEALAPPAAPIATIVALERQSVERLGEHRAADLFDDDVDPAPLGGVEHRGGEVVGEVVDRHGGALLGAYRRLRRRRRRRR